MPEVTVVLPAFNEEKSIGPVLKELVGAMRRSRLSFEILLIDDGSTDATVRRGRKAYPKIRVLSHKRRLGEGAARKTGIRVAKGKIILTLDADGTYPCKEIPNMLKAMKHADMVVGARRREAGTLKFLRTPAKHFIRVLAQFIVGQSIPDLNSGLRAFRRDVALRFFHILPNTHSLVSTITLAFMSNGYIVRYIPIDYRKRIGVSTFRPLTDTAQYIILVVRTVTYFNPIKFFFLPTVLLIGVPIFRFLFMGFRLRLGDIVMLTAGILVFSLGVLADLIVQNHKRHYLPDIK